MAANGGSEASEGSSGSAAAPPPGAPDFARQLARARAAMIGEDELAGMSPPAAGTNPPAAGTSPPAPEMNPPAAGRNPRPAGESEAMASATISPPGDPALAAGHMPAPHLGTLLHRLLVLGEHLAAWLARPRVRLVVVGVLLLVIGAVFVTSSVWTLPLVIIGAVMVLVAWIGSRLDGQFAVEWGERGTELQFRARIRSPAPLRPALSPASPAARPPAPATPAASGDAASGGAASGDVVADVVEGQAHTVEIDVTELKALIAAAEAEQAERDVAKAALRLVSERETAG